MSPKEHLLRQALELSRDERAELVMQLIATLDVRGEEESEALWLRHVCSLRAERGSSDDWAPAERVTPTF